MSHGDSKTEARQIGFKADLGLIDRIDAYRDALKRETQALASAFGIMRASTINRSVALRSLCLLGLNIAEVDRDLVQLVFARAAAAGRSVGAELEELLRLGLAEAPPAELKPTEPCACAQGGVQ